MGKEKVMDWTTSIGTVAVLLFAVMPMMAFPEASEDIITGISSAISDSVDSIYLFMGLAIFCFIMYTTFGKCDNITLDKASDRPEFSAFTQAAMLFCAGVGSDILYRGIIEWAFYYQVPPNGARSMSDEALQYVTQYGMFHWGPIAWAIHALPALPIGCLVFVKKQPMYRISQVCHSILKGQTDKFVGKVASILFIFKLLGGAATSLVLGVPLISAGIRRLTDLDGKNVILRSAILLTITVILATSPYTGLRRGIQELSDIDVWLSFVLLAFIFIIGPTVFIMETTAAGFGSMLKDFFHMAAWSEPFDGIKGRKETNLPQDWTIFYWSWWLVYAPFIGLSVARISKGRRLKEAMLGTITYGTLGCVLFFGIFGNYAVYLQISGQFNVTQYLDTHGTEATIIEVVHHSPFPSLMIVLFLVSVFLFLATTFDSGSCILAVASQKKVVGEPLRANRLFWAFALCLLPFSLMLAGGERALEVLKAASILASVPLIVIFIFMIISFLVILGHDRIKPEARTEKLKKVERRSLRIVQVSGEEQNDSL